MADKCKKKECPPEGAPMWVVTYGDMMSLLLTFFALMLSFSTINEVKFDAAISSFQDGLGIWPSNAGILPQLVLYQNPEKAVVDDAEDAEEVIEELIQYLQNQGIEDIVEIYNTPSGLRLIISSPLLFESGQAQIRTQFASFLSTIAGTIKEKKFSEIRVEGHTDNIPINTPDFPSNWELSAARAMRVVKFFAFEENLDPSKLSGVGYGEFRPRATNDTNEGRGKNRRVEIFLEFPRGEITTKEFTDI
jgi:chemotaxis protein MotB